MKKIVYLFLLVCLALNVELKADQNWTPSNNNQNLSASNENVYISGILNSGANHSISINNCNVFFAQDAQLIIGSSSTLYSNKSTLAGLSSAAWNGVYCDKGTVTFDSSDISGVQKNSSNFGYTIYCSDPVALHFTYSSITPIADASNSASGMMSIYQLPVPQTNLPDIKIENSKVYINGSTAEAVSLQYTIAQFVPSNVNISYNDFKHLTGGSTGLNFVGMIAAKVEHNTFTNFSTAIKNYASSTMMRYNDINSNVNVYQLWGINASTFYMTEGFNTMTVNNGNCVYLTGSNLVLSDGNNSFKKLDYPSGDFIKGFATASVRLEYNIENASCNSFYGSSPSPIQSSDVNTDYRYSNNTLIHFNFACNNPQRKVDVSGNSISKVKKLISENKNVNFTNVKTACENILQNSTSNSEEYEEAMFILQYSKIINGNYESALEGYGQMMNSFSRKYEAKWAYESLKNYMSSIGRYKGNDVKSLREITLMLSEDLARIYSTDNNLTEVQNRTFETPQQYKINQNYPNPFNPVTNIGYSIPKEGFVKIKIYDITGKLVTELVNDFKEAGNYSVEFNGANLSSGTYFYRMESSDFVQIKKMILMK